MRSASGSARPCAVGFARDRQHRLDTLQRGGLLGGAVGTVPGDEDVHRAAELDGGGERLLGGIIELAAGVLGDQ